MKAVLAVLCLLAASACAEVYFKETFNAGWEDRWVQSTHNGDKAGAFVASAGKFYNDAEADKGIKTSEDARFYGLSAKFDSFDNTGKKLIIQFLVKHEQNIDCGGGYVKLFPIGLDQGAMSGDSEYFVMFGPDICGPGTRKVHVIFNYKGQNHLIKKNIPCKADEESHVYTLIINEDQTYQVDIDGSKVESGSLLEDWDFLPPKQINDPEQSKPSDWVDDAQIDDPEDTKPADWDQPKTITDPDAEKPDDWDDDMDGEWEAPTIDNPDYKGTWSPKRIDNPAYKGVWEHPQIDNPEYAPDDSIGSYTGFGAIGFDLWQVKSGTIFDDVIITDDADAANEMVAAWKTRSAGEAAMKKAADDAAAAEAAAAAAEAADDDDEEDDEEEEAPAKDEL
jgi:calreticulin